ncbi:hypothetical protein L9F63_003394, partial [Diploptera punctata]
MMFCSLLVVILAIRRILQVSTAIFMTLECECILLKYGSQQYTYGYSVYPDSTIYGQDIRNYADPPSYTAVTTTTMVTTMPYEPAVSIENGNTENFGFSEKSIRRGFIRKVYSIFNGAIGNHDWVHSLVHIS